MNITIIAIRKQRNQDDSKPEVARMLTALPLWTATEILWMRWRCDMGSNVVLFRCRPRSEKNDLASGPKTPRDSTAIGKKRWLVSRWAYLHLFFFSACSATAPASLVDKVMYDGASVSGQVASQSSGLPCLQGMMDIPSGLLPSDRERPGGSSWLGNPAASSDLLMMLLIAV